MAIVQQLGRSIASSWKLWLPPVVLTLIVYLVIVFLAGDLNMSMFAYKQF